VDETGIWRFQEQVPPQLDEVDEDETISDAVMPDPDPPAPAPATTSATQVNPKILKEMKKLGGWFNPDAEDYIAKASQATNTQLGREPAAVANAVFDEATIECLFAECPDFAFYSGEHEKPNPQPEPSEEIEVPEHFQEAFHCPT